MHPIQRISCLLALSLATSLPGFGQDRLPACGEETLRAFASFVERLDSSREAGANVEVPSLEGCNPDAELGSTLAAGLGGAVAAAWRSGDREQTAWAANVLRQVRYTYQQAVLPGDFQRLAQQLYAAVESELGEPLVVRQPAEPPSDYGSLEPLIASLAAPPAREPERVREPVAAETPKTGGLPETGAPVGVADSSAEAQDGGGWLLPTLVGIAAVLTLFVAWVLRRKERQAVGYDGTRPEPAAKPSVAPEPSAEPRPPQVSNPGATDRRPDGADEHAVPPLVGSRPSAGPSGVAAADGQLRDRSARLERRAHEPAPAIDAAMQQQVQGLAARLESTEKEQAALNAALESKLQRFEDTVAALQKTSQQHSASLEAAIAELKQALADGERRIEELRRDVSPPLVAQFQAEQALLQEDWKRFLATKKEIGELVERFAADGEHKVIFDELLNELPGAVESDPQLSQVAASKLAPVRLFNQHIKQLGQVARRAEQELPATTEEQKRRLLVLRDSSHLLSTLRNTGLGDELLSFSPGRWCAEELPELADLFLRHYQVAQAEGWAAGLEKAREVLEKALRIGKLTPIEIVLGRTDFDSSIHVGRSKAAEPRYPAGTIVRVVKNGFRSLRDGRVVVQPEVIVNRLD